MTITIVLFAYVCGLFGAAAGYIYSGKKTEKELAAAGIVLPDQSGRSLNNPMAPNGVRINSNAVDAPTVFDGETK